MPKRQVLWTKSTPNGLRCSWSKPQRMFAWRTQRVMLSRSSSVKPNRDPHRCGLREVEHLAGGDPAARQAEQLAGDAEQRVGLDERAVGEAHPQPVRRVCAVHDVAEPEVRVDQRCVGLDVRAHHQDVARFQRGIVGEQAEQNLAEHVDLAGRTVAAVHLDGPVVIAQRSGRPDGPRWRRCRTAASRAACRDAHGHRGIRRCAGRRAGCAGARAGRGRGWPAVGGPTLRWLVSSRRGIGPCSPASFCHRSSLGCGSQRWRSWWVARASSSSTSVAGSRVCPNRDRRSGRSVGDSLQPRKCFGVPNVRRVGVDSLQQRTPQRRLPVEVGIDITGDITFPVDQ